MQFVKVSGHTDVDLDGFSQNCSLVRVINCMLVAMLSIGVACDVMVLLLPLFLGRMLWLRPCRWSRINSKIPSTKGKIKIHIIRHLLSNLALHCGFLATISSLATQDWGMWCCFIAAEYSIPQAGVRTALHRHSLFLLFQQIAQLACAVQAPSHSGEYCGELFRTWIKDGVVPWCRGVGFHASSDQQPKRTSTPRGALMTPRLMRMYPQQRTRTSLSYLSCHKWWFEWIFNAQHSQCVNIQDFSQYSINAWFSTVEFYISIWEPTYPTKIIISMQQARLS